MENKYGLTGMAVDRWGWIKEQATALAGLIYVALIHISSINQEVNCRHAFAIIPECIDSPVLENTIQYTMSY
jgi:hypothetical protein